MKKIITISLIFLMLSSIYAVDLTQDYSNFNFSTLPKTSFSQEKQKNNGSKVGLANSDSNSIQNETDVSMPDKKLMRSFQRFIKVDAFGDELGDEFLFYKWELSKDQQSVYDEVYKALMNNESNVQLITRIHKSEIEDVITAVYYDNPEIFWWACDYTYWFNRSTEYVTSVDFRYLFPTEQIQQIYEKFASMSFPVIFYAAMLDTDMDRIKYIHDYLCLSIEYDWDSYNSGNYGGKLQTAYSAVCEYKTVCAGYSRAFAYYLQQLRIPCTVLSGSGHAWNMTKIGSEFYQMDVTWNDGNDMPPYFLLPNKDMQKVSSHTPTVLASKVIASHPTSIGKFSYKGRFGSTPIGRPYTYQEFNNIQMDIINPLFAEIYTY